MCAGGVPGTLGFGLWTCTWGLVVLVGGVEEPPALRGPGWPCALDGMLGAVHRRGCLGVLSLWIWGSRRPEGLTDRLLCGALDLRRLSSLRAGPFLMLLFPALSL